MFNDMGLVRAMSEKGNDIKVRVAGTHFPYFFLLTEWSGQSPTAHHIFNRSECVFDSGRGVEWIW